MTNQPRRWAIRRAFAVVACLLLVATACRDDASAANTTVPTGPPRVEVKSGDQTAILRPFAFCWDTAEGERCAYGIPPEPLPSLGTFNDGIDVAFPAEGFTFTATFTRGSDCDSVDCRDTLAGQVIETGRTSWRVMPPPIEGSWTAQLRGSGPAGQVIVEFSGDTNIPVFSVEHVVTAAFEGLTTVTGYLFAPDDQPVQICSALTESNPPQCETPALAVQGFDIETLHGWSASGGSPTANTVIWTADPIEITGRIDSGVLTVRSTNPDSSTSVDDTPQVPTRTSETEDTP